jgi:hypothetical protein
VYDHITNIRHTQAALASPRGQHILQPMLCFQQLDVTNPVDKFHGYRGLHSAKAPLPQPDLARSVQEVFEEIAVWSLFEFGDLFPLALDLRGNISARLPSWVPDWSAKPSIIHGYWRGRHRFYKAPAQGAVVENPFDYVSPGTLLIRGTKVETVTTVSSAVFVEPMGARDHVDLLRAWFTFATGRQCSQIADGLFNDDVFCATMLGGLVQTDQKPFANGVSHDRCPRPGLVQIKQRQLWRRTSSNSTRRLFMALEQCQMPLCDKTSASTAVDRFSTHFGWPLLPTPPDQ